MPGIPKRYLLAMIFPVPGCTGKALAEGISLVSVISLDDQFYDSLTQKYQYLYTVETDSGERGGMMIPGICFGLKQIAF